MQLVNQKAEILERSESKINNIANIARICYKSESKADDESNKRLIENLIKNKHFAMLEHEDYILYFNNIGKYNDYCRYVSVIEKYFGVKLHLIICGNNIISGNIRAWRKFYKYIKMLYQNNQMGDIKYIPVPLIFDDNIFFNDILNNDGHFAFNINNTIRILKSEELTNKYDCLAHYRVSVKFVTDRGISHEIVRHRNFSFAQESTRYVNYNKKGIEFIDYAEYNKLNNPMLNLLVGINNEATTDMYNGIINNGYEPQLARAVLPHNLKTEIIVTGNLREWCHFFNLRYFERTGKAHPMIKELAEQIYNELESKTQISKKLIDNWAAELWENENE